MNGDVIRRLRQYAPWIGHIHVAGVPGRGELDERQEIYYPGVMRACWRADTGATSDRSLSPRVIRTRGSLRR